MVQIDDQFTSVITRVAKGVLNLGFVTVCTGEVIVTHGHRGAAIFVDHSTFVFPTHISIRCNCKSAVFSAFGANEIAQRTVNVATELILSCECRLEEDLVAIFISIESVDVIGCGS